MAFEDICYLIIGIEDFVLSTIYFIHEIINTSAFIKRIKEHIKGE